MKNFPGISRCGSGAFILAATLTIGALALPSIASAQFVVVPKTKLKTEATAPRTCLDMKASEFDKYRGGCHLWVNNSAPHDPFIQLDCRTAASDEYSQFMQLKAEKNRYLWAEKSRDNEGVTEPAKVAALFSDCGKLLDRAYSNAKDEENRADSTYFSGLRSGNGDQAQVKKSLELSYGFKPFKKLDPTDPKQFDYWLNEIRMSGESMRPTERASRTYTQPKGGAWITRHVNKSPRIVQPRTIIKIGEGAEGTESTGRKAN